MAETNDPLNWQFDSRDLYIPITYEGSIVGFGKPKLVAKIVDALNDEEKLGKALQMACIDLLRQSGGDPNTANLLAKKYIAKVERPKFGTAAIAALLRDRQAELDISDQEFTKFCDSYRLPPAALNNIYAGEKINNNWLTPIARILGKSVEEVTQVRDGFKAS